MKSKLDGAGSKRNGAGASEVNQVSTPHLRMLMTEAASASDAVSISWTPTAHERSAELRRERIAMVAYYLSEARGFVPGHDAEDWLLAQAQVDAMDAGTFEG